MDKKLLFSLIKKIRHSFVIFFLISLFSGITLYSERFCKGIKGKDNKKCLIARTIEKPGKIFLQGYINTRSLLKNYLLTSDFTITGELARDPIKTANRFKNLKPRFNFNFIKGTKPDYGFLILSEINSANAKPLVEIWDLNKQKLIHKYKFNFSDIRKLSDFKNAPEIEFQHPLILDDGSLIVIGSAGNQPIIKFNSCGDLLKLNNEYKFHHSIEKDNEGFIYVPIYSSNKNLSKSMYKFDFKDDGFAVMDKELNIVKIYSLLKIYEKNGLISDLFGKHEAISDPFHLNDVQPLIRDDGTKVVLLSLRHQSSILALDLETEKILWIIERAGLLQHDVDIIAKKGNFIDISFFDNNVRQYVNVNTKGNKFITLKNLDISRNRNIEFINSSYVHNLYKIKKYDFTSLPNKYIPKTITEGRADLNIKYNSVFIEESNMGRLLEIDLNSGKIDWQYINKHKNIGIPRYMSWSRRISNKNFSNIFEKCE